MSGMMKYILLIIICFTNTGWCSDIDFFNESIETVGAHPSVENVKSSTPSVLSSSGNDSSALGQTANQQSQLAPLTEPQTAAIMGSNSSPPPPHHLIVPTVIAFPNPKAGPKEYLQKKLMRKEQEISATRNDVLTAKDGTVLRNLSSNLTRLEAERQQLMNTVKNTPVSQGNELSNQPVLNEKDTFKAQLVDIDKQMATLHQQIQRTTDANILNQLSASLERLQQNRKLIELSLNYAQQRAEKTSKIGFDPRLLPIPQKLTPGLQPNLNTSLMPFLPTANQPFPPAPTAPMAPANEMPDQQSTIIPLAPIRPVDQKQLSGNEWQKLPLQRSNKDAITLDMVAAPSRPLWTPPDTFEGKVSTKTNNAPADRIAIIEKIRKKPILVAKPMHAFPS